MEVPKCIKEFNELTDFLPLEEYIVELIRNKKTFFVYVASNHTSGKSWCSDCDNAYPYIQNGLKLFGSQETVPFINCTVDRDTWRNQSNYYRTHNKLKLKSVPTLIYFDGGVEFGRLVEGELLNDEAIKEFFTNPKY